MQTFRKSLGIMFFVCAFISVLLVGLFVNFTVGNKFDKYVENIQEERRHQIINSLEAEYAIEGGWNENSGLNTLHDAYMGNYCLTLFDENKNIIWGMDPYDLRNRLHLGTMPIEDSGVYTTQSYNLEHNGEVVGFIEIGQYSALLLTGSDIEFKNAVNNSIFVGGGITMLATFMLGLYISKHFSEPVKKAANQSIALSKGEYGGVLSSRSRIVEIEMLRNSVNTLAERLEKQDGLRKRLISDISHEIRNPLNILQNNLEAMMDGIIPIDDESLNMINDEVIRFGKLLENLNALNDLEDQNAEFIFEETNLQEILKEVCMKFEITAKSKNVELEFISDQEENSWVSADKSKLKQVFINLISNAVKYNVDGGRVEVLLTTKDGKPAVAVKDTGVGISKEDVPYIFERLYRDDKSRNMVEGNGLGLSIAKKILEYHNASIAVKSSLGIGSVFEVVFNV
ncbi:sensor histidine kinase [Alkalibacter saccharofermentans]|uniref:histidine kinase n=1 Tax=Alkalibacter saccharofermentans DSM 14828 TaxID=1120975 RepID=A0A1M4WWQ0_9FIRM|nr:HAMP domain-containing sensor histidine kinase [Alkalibacter saccharofermentans]SHE85674.1 Signal transduction histidine kinase [Alkalibacter saccharofermentans DSM 14828]